MENSPPNFNFNPNFNKVKVKEKTLTLENKVKVKSITSSRHTRETAGASRQRQLRESAERVTQQARDALVEKCVRELDASGSEAYFYKCIWALGANLTRTLLESAQAEGVRNPKAYFLASSKRQMLLRQQGYH